MADQSKQDRSLPALGTELWDLVRAYAKQETIEPIKGLGRFVAFGVPGSMLIGLGVVLITLALLRALQTETGEVFDGNWTFAPYLITLVLCGVVVALAASAMRKKRVDKVRSR